METPVKGTELKKITINPFHAFGLFLYPLNTENQRVFLYFQGLYKKTSSIKWVDDYDMVSRVFSFCMADRLSVKTFCRHQIE